MNRPVKRQLWLLNTLLRYKKLSFKELQSKWKDSYLNDDDSELSLRTFHGHKDAIEELLVHPTNRVILSLCKLKSLNLK